MRSINSLKKRTNGNKLQVQHEKGHVMDVIFEWNNGVSEEVIIKVQSEIGHSLPKDYIEFLKVTNGATMFKDFLFGQWGFKILPLDTVMQETKKANSIGYNIPETVIVIAKSFGDGDMLLIDLQKAGNGEAYIIDGEQGYQYEDWEVIDCNFECFLDRLIVAQGTKYWRWN